MIICKIYIKNQTNIILFFFVFFLEKKKKKEDKKKDLDKLEGLYHEIIKMQQYTYKLLDKAFSAIMGMLRRPHEAKLILEERYLWII